MSARTSHRQLLRSSLPRRTLAGFLAAIVAILAIAVLSWLGLGQREQNVEQMTRAMQSTRQLRRVMSTVQDAETGQRGYMLTNDTRYLEPYERAVAAMPIERTNARQLIARDEVQLERMAELERLIDEKLAELGNTVEMTRTGRAEEAVMLVRSDRGKVVMDRIRALVDQMQATERALLARQQAEWGDASATATMVTFAGSALLLFLIIGATVLSARDYRAQQIQAWLRIGQAELNDTMSGEQAATQLGERVLGYLAEVTVAQLGLLHVVDGGGALRRVASRGTAAGDRSSPLAQQVVRDGKLVHLEEVPSDYATIESGLGAARPRHVVLAPAAVDGAVVAVIELGFLARPTVHDLELLGRAGEAVAIAFRSVRLREERENLLEETQRQAEELQTQQEELRVSNEELEEQSRALQSSQAQLQNQQAELEQINAQLEEQMQSVAKQRDDLTRAQGELQRANVYKSEFLANMSHELRTPLNSSLILAKLLMDNRGGNLTGEQVKFAQTIYAAGNDLLTLINDILDLSKIEAGKLDVRPEAVPLARLFDELRATFEPVARERRLELVLEQVAGTPASIHTDPNRLAQVLRNLMSNALKFTERGGVTVRVRRDAERGGVAFEVQDTGIGIAADQQGVIFEAFRQADGTTNRKYGGTGLGLSISRDLARLLGGDLTVASEPGRGSTFTLRVPERIEGAAPVVVELPAPRPAAPPPPAVVPAAAEPMRRGLLIIEDDVPFSRIIADLARELDFQPIVAHTAEQGLALAHRHRPSAIVLDVGLPDRSGLSVLDALKHDPVTRHIPVHMASVSDYSQTALEMGAAGYVIKPVQREQLVEALRRLEAKFTQKLRRVLVVEDDARQRESTCLLLAADDVETVAVGTAAAALEQLAHQTFDCMVLDLNLPDLTGFELLEKMSGGEAGSAFPPVIVYTGRSLSRDDEQRLRRYSNAIIIKGARSPERLLDEVTLFLHQVESELPPDRQRMLRDARHREAVFEDRRVLVVEDDVRNIFALSSVLEPKGAKVEIARNGKEALAHLRDHPGVDLVLMDIMMPEMDGLQAMREIRKRPELRRLPIIALTAKAMTDDRENCLAAGANDYIAKPLDVDKLLSLARVWMPK